MRPVPVLPDYLVKLVIPSSRAILKPTVIYRCVSLVIARDTNRISTRFFCVSKTCHDALPPDPINHVYSLPGKYMSEKYFTYPSVQIFKILFRGFYSQKSNKNMILRTRPCGSAFIIQHSWLLHFHQAEICIVEMICTIVVPTSKGHLGGASAVIFLHDS